MNAALTLACMVFAKMDLISTRAHAMVMHVVRSVMSWQAQQVGRLKSSNLSQNRKKTLNFDTMLVKTIFDFTCLIFNTTVSQISRVCALNLVKKFCI